MYTSWIDWGISFGSHDSAIAVFNNKKLVFATEGERWSKKKHDKTLPPQLLEYVKDKYGEPDNIYYFENYNTKEHRRKAAGQNPKEEPYLGPQCDCGYHYKDWTVTDHHHSHASWGYYTSPFEDCTVLVVDSIGEWETMSKWRCSGGMMSKTNSWQYPSSLGLMYTSATMAGGWKGNSEEYKMMGAAAFGKGQKEYKILKELWESDYNFHKGWPYEGDPFEIAAGAQRLYEEVLMKIIKWIEGPLVLVGGCALNVSVTRLIENELYIPPAPNDAGSAIGCAIHRFENKRKFLLDFNPFQGYNIDKELRPDFIVKELKESGIVGVANGRAEFGPRALGNRSILADPEHKDWKLKLNKIKNREPWRPYGVMVREKDMSQFFNETRPSPYMGMCFTANKVMQESIPSVIHKDGTVRVQTITEEHPLWELFDTFPMLVNTSLNIKGKPIVNDEADVIEMRNKTNLVIL